MSTRNYVSLDKLTTFLNNLKNVFALKNHTHTVDSALSETSTNPVQNKVVNEEFDAIAEGMNALELAIDSKANDDHTHDFIVVSNAKPSTACIWFDTEA